MTGHAAGAAALLLVFGCSEPEGAQGARQSDGGGMSLAGTTSESAGGTTNAGGRGTSGDDAGGTDASDAGTASNPGSAGQGVIPGADCGLEAPAFCDTFEQGPLDGGRSGELDPARWSVLRAVPSLHAELGFGYEIQPALMPECRPGVSGSMAVPDDDTVICEPTATIQSRHFLGAVAAQNYGLNTYRVRQPFDFEGRTGTISLDAELYGGGLHGWPAIAISEEPSPAPSYDFPERGSGARNGVQIEFNVGWCNTPNTVLPTFFTSRDFLETEHEFSWDCEQAHAQTARGALNHVEIRVSASRIEVWASDASPDGLSFANFQRIGVLEYALPFTRGYVSLITRNHATLKYWGGASWATRWDNVGFDGPVIAGWREYSAPEPLGVTDGLLGCLVASACEWRGRVIADHPDEDGVCGEDCAAEGEGRTVGWVVPNESEDEAPVAVEIPGVRLAGVIGARLVLAADYPWFAWNDVFPPPTALNLRYRVNGGDFHDRFVSETEVNAFGGDQGGAGLLNQIIELDKAELVEGTNVVEFQGSGTWTGAYRMAVVGVDLVLATEP